jgi:hypothetical protein
VALSLNHFADETTMHSVCVVELHVIVNYIKILSLHNNAFMLNLCRRQQCKLYVAVFEINYIPTNFTYKCCIEIKMNICSWPSLDYSLVEQIVNKSLRSFSVFVSVALKKFTNPDGINHL